MKDITPYISPLLESQFPSFYKEEGTKFIAFVKAYYEWLEQQNNVLYYSRNLLNLRDIDKTIDDFIVYFKEETLKNVQFDTATDKRLLVKNALDIYRSKGTARAIDLFFKLVFAQPAKVTYPGDNLFRLSDNTWKEAEYIEVSDTPYNSEFEGKQITGVTSGATAFVENISIRKKVNYGTDNNGNKINVSKNIIIYFISNRKGNFVFGEKIVHSGTVDPRKTPTIIGSLNNVQVITKSYNYEVGDIVSLQSNNGLNGKAIVTSVINTTGEVDFQLIKSGWGFSENPNILISERVFVINSVSVSNSLLSTPFTQFENIIQPKANIDYISLTGGYFQSNDLIYTYYANNSLAGIGKIISASISSQDITTGNLYVSVISGNLEANAIFYNFDNTIYANTSVYLDKTAKANVMAITSNSDFILNNVNNGILFVKGERIFQANSTVELANGVVDSVSKNGSNLQISVSNINGLFSANSRTYGAASGADANLFSYSTRVGIIDFSSTLIDYVAIEANGINYSNSDIVTFSSNTGSGATARIVTTATGAIANVVVYRSGSGYITAPSVIVQNTSTSFYFDSNNSISDSENFIVLNDHTFKDGQAIRYAVTAGSTVLSGLVNNSIYYVRYSNNLGIKISSNPSGTVIDLTPGLTQNGHSFTSVVSSGSGATLTAHLGNAFDLINDLYVYGETSNTYGSISEVSQGSSASFKIISLDDEETVSLNTDIIDDFNIYGATYLDMLIDGSGNTALSGSNAYGFPAGLSANLNSTIGSALQFENYTIGSIGAINVSNPGLNYTLDPLVSIKEPAVYGYKKSDYVITISGDTARFSAGENLLFSTDNVTFVKIAKLTDVIDESSIKATRYTLLTDVNESGTNYLKGETSGFLTTITNVETTDTFSGFNASVLADVIAANGAVANLTVIDSGFGYERFEILNFIKEGDETAIAGTCKALVERQGKSEGYFQNTRGFLSQDKYIHDGDYYQEYSYELISRVPFERYFEMLKNILHVAGTKVFPAVEVESNILIGITANRNLQISKTFNPSISVNTTDNFITIADNIFANSELVVYSVETGNTVIPGLSNNEPYYVAYANSTGFKLSTTANGSSIVDLTSPLTNETGHEIHNII